MRTATQKPHEPHQRVFSNRTGSPLASPAASHPAISVLQWQRTLGNQAVQRLLQAQLEHPEACYGKAPGTLSTHDGNQGPTRDQAPGSLQAQRTQTSDGEQTVPPIVEDIVSSPGHPLPLATRTLMEERFGQDFSQVRVHTDGTAATAARAIQARAYTIGRDIVFGAAEYAPQAVSGQRLLAHELTHVLQQTGAVQRSPQLLQRSTTAGHHDTIMRAPSQEKRALGEKDSVWEGDGWRNIGDAYDYTIVVARPDGTGAQLTFVPAGKKTENEEPFLRLTNVVELSKRRVKALEQMSKQQGTFQETEAQRVARANQYTMCNAWPVNVGNAVDSLAGTQHAVTDTMDSAKGQTKKSNALNNLNPEGAARKYGAWRTWADTPGGPKPGDIYSFWEAVLTWEPGTKKEDQTSLNAKTIDRKTGTIKHIGIFKSRRPNTDGKTETWTVVDGGQGSRDERQQIWERSRTFDIKTQIFTTRLADGGQGADPRWISGWLDLDAYYDNPETDATKADYDKWSKAGGANKTRYETPQAQEEAEK